MSEMPRPVRGWAEYDEWSGFLYPTISDEWAGLRVPKTGQGMYGIHAFKRELPILIEHMDCGPLRSIRILLSTGEEVSMDCCVEDGYFIDGMFAWELRDGEEWPHGGLITDLSDSDAVTRALAEAVAWVQGQEGQGIAE